MSADRRQSFRIENQVALVYKVVSEDELERNAADIKQGGFLPGGMSATLFGMEAELKGRIGRVRQTSAEIAHSLDLLNNKLNALINLMPLLQEDEENIFQQPMRHTNVSASGISFVNEEELAAGACLYLRLVLAPDYYYVAAYAKVVRSQPMRNPRDGFKYRVAVDFTLISDQHRELLVKYTMSRELAQLRARRMAAEASEFETEDADTETADTHD
ncbi:MAG: PilZ domain-containing protein [Gammaproteobacteria bacterium]|nr:PilZ domain-containing protein [Gammaproteobacteria bacterium]MDH3769277.1 PilZ domain-containing protein [Gammaproteobacteria bacterium]